MALARPINEEWKMRPYFGVFPFFFRALEKDRDDTILKIYTHTAKVTKFLKSMKSRKYKNMKVQFKKSCH